MLFICGVERTKITQSGAEALAGHTVHAVLQHSMSMVLTWSFWRHALQQSLAVLIGDAPDWLPASSTMIFPWKYFLPLAICHPHGFQIFQGGIPLLLNEGARMEPQHSGLQGLYRVPPEDVWHKS